MDYQLEVLLEEYASTRQQSLDMTSQIRLIVGIGLPLIIILFVYAFEKESNIVFLGLPLVVMTILLLLVFSDTIAMALGGYSAAIAEKINQLDIVVPDTLRWELRVSKKVVAEGPATIGMHLALLISFFGVTIYSMFRTNQAYSRMIAAFQGLVVIVLLVFFIWGAINMLEAFDKAFKMTSH